MKFSKISQGTAVSLFLVFLTVITVVTILTEEYFDDSGKRVTIKKIMGTDPVLDQKESCIVCHSDMKGFSPAHDPKAIGCSSCHLGNIFTMDKEKAHKGMELVPGNFQTVDKTCGQKGCHVELTHKGTRTLMASGKGMVSVDRFVFNESPIPHGPGHFDKLGTSQADWHLHQMCSICHLGTKKTVPSPITEESFGGGCTACHLNYSKEAADHLTRYQKNKTFPTVHPALDIQPDNTRCFACHSGSSRISTSFRGWHETTMNHSEAKGKKGYILHNDGRVFKKMPDDVHHQKGIACIDCHTMRDVMGDDKKYNHQNNQVEIECTDCHGNNSPKTVPFADLDPDSKKIMELRKDIVPGRRHILTKRGKAFTNLFRINNRTVLKSKKDGALHYPKDPLPVCTKSISGHERLSCKSCHTSWSPTCIACHTKHDNEVSMLRKILHGRDSKAWMELRDFYLAVPPTMGVREHDGKEIVDTFIPGMILTIDNAKQCYNYNGQPKSIGGEKWQIFKRLYAPTSSHTIVREARNCQSCHMDSRALGYGQGRLTYTGKGTFPWRFTPYYGKHPVDGLPLDAWIAPGTFPTHRALSTRKGARPFTIREQYSILRVGRCLTCHPWNKKSSQKIYKNFNESLRKRLPQCGRD